MKLLNLLLVAQAAMRGLLQQTHELENAVQQAIDNGNTTTDQVPSLNNRLRGLSDAASNVTTAVSNVKAENQVGQGLSTALFSDAANSAVSGSKLNQDAAQRKGKKVSLSNKQQIGIISVFKALSFPVKDSAYYRGKASDRGWKLDIDRMGDRKFSNDNKMVLQFLIDNFRGVNQDNPSIMVAKAIAGIGMRVFKGQLMVDNLNAIANLLWLYEIRNSKPNKYQSLIESLGKGSPEDRKVAVLLETYMGIPMLKNLAWFDLGNEYELSDATVSKLNSAGSKLISEMAKIAQQLQRGRRLSIP